MRILVLLFMIIGTSFASTQNTDKAIPICSLLHFNSVKKKLLDNPNDKYKHCAVSCMLSRRCGALDSYNIGVLKEVWDLFTPGDADIDDLKADLIGINFYLHRRATTDKECNMHCNEYDWSSI